MYCHNFSLSFYGGGKVETYLVYLWITVTNANFIYRDKYLKKSILILIYDR